MGGFDPYSASKGCAELVASSYRNSYFNLNKYGTDHCLLLASCRAGNVIGGGDWAADRLIPDIMKAVSRGETVIIRNPRATRPWQHVLEPLSGYLLVGQKLLEGKKEFAEAWNFGPSDSSSISVEKVVKKMHKYWSKINYRVEQDKNALHEANLLKLDCSKAYKLLNWRYRLDEGETVKLTVDWYKAFYEGQILLTNQQIDHYQKLLS
jgi:CDP-glucose 4,6-dehydratase